MPHYAIWVIFPMLGTNDIGLCDRYLSARKNFITVGSCLSVPIFVFFSLPIEVISYYSEYFSITSIAHTHERTFTQNIKTVPKYVTMEQLLFCANCRASFRVDSIWPQWVQSVRLETKLLLLSGISNEKSDPILLRRRRRSSAVSL